MCCSGYIRKDVLGLRNKTKILTVACLLAVVILFAGCGKKDEQPISSSDVPNSIVYEAEVEVRIDLSGGSTSADGQAQQPVSSVPVIDDDNRGESTLDASSQPEA